MFKKYIMAIVVLLSLFALSSLDTQAQCAIGFTPKSINMNIGGCMYKVDFCVKCNTLLGQGSEISILSITLIPSHPVCTPTIPYYQVVDYANSQMQNPSFFHNVVCPLVPPSPPCDGPEDPRVVTYTSFLCWEAEVISYFGENTLYFRSCSEDVCSETYEICVDGNGQYVRTLIAGRLPVVPTCTEEYDSAPPPLIPFPNIDIDPLGTKSACYIYHSNCNPK